MRMRVAARSRPTSATTARRRRPAGRRRGAGGVRRRPRTRRGGRGVASPTVPNSTPCAGAREGGSFTPALYDGAVPLRLIVGPANAGKVELLLGRYLDALEREPVLIVPNRSDVERVERDLLARRPGILGGFIGTFDDVFERIAGGAP